MKNPCSTCPHTRLRVCIHLCKLPKQLDMFGDQTFGISWKSQKLLWEEKRDMMQASWERRKREDDKARKRGKFGKQLIYVDTNTGEVLTSSFDVKALWISREQQAEVAHSDRIVAEFDERL